MKWRRLIGVLALVSFLATPGQAQARDTGVRDASGGNTRAQTEQTIAVDPTNPKNVLIGSFGGGLSVSHDGGLTWKLASVSCSVDNNPMFDASGVAYFECNYNGVEL